MTAAPPLPSDYDQPRPRTSLPPCADPPWPTRADSSGSPSPASASNAKTSSCVADSDHRRHPLQSTLALKASTRRALHPLNPGTSTGPPKVGRWPTVPWADPLRIGVNSARCPTPSRLERENPSRRWHSRAGSALMERLTSRTSILDQSTVPTTIAPTPASDHPVPLHLGIPRRDNFGSLKSAVAWHSLPTTSRHYPHLAVDLHSEERVSPGILKALTSRARPVPDRLPPAAPAST